MDNTKHKRQMDKAEYKEQFNKANSFERKASWQNIGAIAAIVSTVPLNMFGVWTLQKKVLLPVAGLLWLSWRFKTNADLNEYRANWNRNEAQKKYIAYNRHVPTKQSG